MWNQGRKGDEGQEIKDRSKAKALGLRFQVKGYKAISYQRR